MFNYLILLSQSSNCILFLLLLRPMDILCLNSFFDPAAFEFYRPLSFKTQHLTLNINQGVLKSPQLRLCPPAPHRLLPFLRLLHRHRRICL